MKGPEIQRVFLMSSCYNPRQKSLGQYFNIHIFLSFLASLLKQCILFEIFLQFSLPPPYAKLKLGKNSGYPRPTVFVGWGEGLVLCELENAPETQKCPKTFVHHWYQTWYQTAPTGQGRLSWLIAIHLFSKRICIWDQYLGDLVLSAFHPLQVLEKTKSRQKR